jgi:hypothetical protein
MNLRFSGVITWSVQNVYGVNSKLHSLEPIPFDVPADRYQTSHRNPSSLPRPQLPTSLRIHPLEDSPQLSVLSEQRQWRCQDAEIRFLAGLEERAINSEKSKKMMIWEGNCSS